MEMSCKKTKNILDANNNFVNEDKIMRSDLINITPNSIYKLKIELETAFSEKITPTITLPSKKGWLEFNGERFSYMLSTCNTVKNPSCELLICSELGCFDISYHCEVVDYRKKPFWGSSKVLRNLRMRKEVLSGSKSRYSCNDNCAADFNAYVFTVEWILAE